MAAELGTGTGDGLVTYLDYLVEKGYSTASAVNSWRSAAKQVLSTVEGEGYGKTDVIELDLDDLLRRYGVLASQSGNVKQESIVQYQRRAQKAIESYREYVKDPTSWRPPNGRAGASKAASSTTKKSAKGDAAATGHPGAATTSNGNGSGAALVDYPFPLRTGQIAHVRLPVHLDQTDAERLATFIRTLVFEEQPGSPKG